MILPHKEPTWIGGTEDFVKHIDLKNHETEYFKPESITYTSTNFSINEFNINGNAAINGRFVKDDIDVASVKYITVKLVRNGIINENLTDAAKQKIQEYLDKIKNDLKDQELSSIDFADLHSSLMLNKAALKIMKHIVKENESVIISESLKEFGISKIIDDGSTYVYNPKSEFGFSVKETPPFSISFKGYSSTPSFKDIKKKLDENKKLTDKETEFLPIFNLTSNTEIENNFVEEFRNRKETIETLESHLYSAIFYLFLCKKPFTDVVDMNQEIVLDSNNVETKIQFNQWSA